MVLFHHSDTFFLLKCFMSSCNACNHFTIENFHILSHGSNDFDNKVIEALYIKKQKPLLHKHLHKHGASFLPNLF